MLIFKRFVLVIVMNLLVVSALLLAINSLDLDVYCEKHGIALWIIAVACGAWGVIGMFISMILSRPIVEMLLKIRIVKPYSAEDKALLQLTQHLSEKCGLETIPAVGIYSSPELNAFAIGFSQQQALIAMTSGALINMTPAEIEGLLSHKLSLIKNGDMVTLGLLQGTLNAFTLAFTEVFLYCLSIGLNLKQIDNVKQRDIKQISSYLIIGLFDLCFTWLGNIFLSFVSHKQKLRADKQAASLSKPENLIALLQKLHFGQTLESDKSYALRAFKITQYSLLPNPSLHKRIHALTHCT